VIQFAVALDAADEEADGLRVLAKSYNPGGGDCGNRFSAKK
jgi:hypothetical protein